MNKEEAIRRCLYVLAESECLYLNFGTISENDVLDDLNWLKECKDKKLYEKCNKIFKQEIKKGDLEDCIKKIRNYLFTCR